jgi:hypothetical protein
MFSLWRTCLTVRGPRLGSASLSHRALPSLRVFVFRRMSQMGQGRRSRAAVRGSAFPQKADQPLLQSIISSVPIADMWRACPDHPDRTRATIEPE